MFILIRTFLDIALLHKGADALPPSWLVLCVAAGLWLVGIAVMAAVVPGLAFGDLATEIAGWALSIALFGVVIAAAGFPARLAQALGAVAGSGSIVLFAQVVAAVVLIPLAGTAAAGAALEVLLLWSIFVKGRIVAAAINVHTLIGVAISIIVYVLRLFASYSLASTG